MGLLELEHVDKRYRRGRHEYVALEDVSLTVQPGEHVAVWGVPRSGRTTLVRIAAGLEHPDGGRVRFNGRALPLGAGASTPDGIGFVQTKGLAVGGSSVLDNVAMPLLARGLTRSRARARAAAALDRVGASASAGLRAADLQCGELVRAAIAQALVAEPHLLVIDDPTRDVELLERESVLLMLRSIAGGDTAVLMTTGEAIGVSGVDRALTISEGQLRTEVVSEPSPVIPLARRTAALQPSQ